MQEIKEYISRNKIIFLYYLVLLLFVVLRTSEEEPNIIIRFGFLSAFFAPLIIKYKSLFPGLLIAFMTIGTYGFAYNFFPYMMGMYVIIIIVGMFIGKQNRYFNAPLCYIFALLYFLFVELFNTFTINNFIFCFAITLMMIYYLGRDRQLNLFLLLNCFCVAAISLSLIYLLNYEKFLADYMKVDEMKRSGWTDPNYLSCIVGMGVVTAVYQLLTVKNAFIGLKAFWLATISFTLIAQVLMASRGGLLSVGAACTVLIFMTKTKFSYKMAFLLAIAVFIVWMYRNSYFALLEYRIMHDSGTGSGRTEVWMRKLNDFSNGGFLQALFGVGSYNSYFMGGYANGFGFHNDFIAVLCQYGYIGFVVFVSMLLRPFYKLKKEGFYPVFAMVIYIVLTCLTLEPFTAGRLTYFGFYLMVLVMANSLRTEKTTVL